MLNVFFTVDVEVWCESWKKLDQQFPGAFRQYVYGPTLKGDYGLPYMLDVLSDHGLSGVFFVEPLFSTRFGIDPLAEIIGIIRERDQDVQLHLHTEWVDESLKPLLDNIQSKCRHLRSFSFEAQTTLIAAGAKLFMQAGGGEIAAFRAGNFGFNRDTLRALKVVGIPIDSSYNASQFGTDSGVMNGSIIVEPILCEEVYEYPMTVFNDGTGVLRHAQLGACSYKEMEGLLWEALQAKRNSFVILSHNFELLNRAKNRSDDVAVKRFRKLCTFLDRNRDSFRVQQFQGLKPLAVEQQPTPLSSSLFLTGARMLEQTYRRRFG